MPAGWLEKLIILAGSLYPDGIPIHSQNDLAGLIRELKVDICAYSYSDVSYRGVMSTASIVNAAGADFVLHGTKDGPTLTHGGMMLGAGIVAAIKFGAAEIIDPRPFAVGRIKETFDIYPEIGQLLPAMGYGKEQMDDLQETINKADCDTVIIGTPIDLSRILNIDKPMVRVGYDLQEIGKPDLDDVITGFLKDKGLM